MVFVESQQRNPEPRWCVDPYRARDGFQSAAHIGPMSVALETRLIQSVRSCGSIPIIAKVLVSRRLNYLRGRPRLYVVLEWDAFKEGWKSVIVETLPVVANTWMEKEYEYQVRGPQHAHFGVFWTHT